MEDNSNTRIQHIPEFSKILNSTYRNVKPLNKVSKEEGETKAVLPATHMKSVLFGSKIVSQPFIDCGGFLGEITRKPLKNGWKR